MTAHTGWGEWPAWLDDTDETPACRGHDTAWWFPKPARDGGSVQETAMAKAICSACPLLVECKAWALDQSPGMLHGIWGGLTASERRRHPDQRRGVQPAQFRRTNTSTTTRSA